MKKIDNHVNTIPQSLEFRRFYFFACIGFSLIGLTYLSREMLSHANEGLAFILGIMPSLAGSFATPYLLLILMANQRRNQALLRSRQVFFLLNLFVLGMCVLIEFLHLWLDLGGFHRNDILASIAGVLMALLSFHLIGGKELPGPPVVSKP